MRAADVGPLSPDTLHVYPTGLKAESALREQARRAGRLLGRRVTTFPQLTDALARDLGVAARVLEPELAAVVLADALERADVPESLRAPQRGLLRALLDVIGELQAAYLDPEAVRALAARLPPGTADRVGELARVYAAYAAGLARLGAVDRHGRDWRVCDALAAAERDGRPPRTLAGIRRIVFAEIYDFSVLQFLIATSLIRLVGDAELIAFAHPENVDATRFLERTWNRFVGDAGIADQVLPSFVLREGRQGDLAAALRGVFAADRPPPAPRDGSIRLVAASSRYREVEAAVRAVRRKLADGVPPERLALLARDLALYGDLIEDVCRRYRVPVYFRKGKPLLASGVARAVLDVVRCVADGFPRPRLEALLDSDYVGASDPGLVHELRRAGYVSERARPLDACLAPGAGERLRALVARLRPLDGRRSIRAHVDGLRTTLRGIEFRAVRTVLGADVARRDARAWDRIDASLASLAGASDALGRTALPLAGFLRLLLAVLEPQEVEDRAQRVGSVRALSVLDARGLDFDTVWLLGLDDGTFPAPRSESPLLPDGLKRALNPLAAELLRAKLVARGIAPPVGALFRTAREASLEDPFLFFLALSMPERELVLSWPVMDERGNPTVRSPFVDEVAACLAGGLAPEPAAPAAVVPRLDDCCEPAELVARAALDRWAGTRGAGPDRLAPALRVLLPDGAARLAAIDRRARIAERRSRYFLSAPGAPAKEALADAHVGRLGGDGAAIRERLARRAWTPTQLERLGACGFKFFADALVGLRDEREPDLELEAYEHGKLVHAVLHRFLQRHPVLPADLAQARALGRRFLAGVRAEAEAEATVAAKDPHFLGLAWTRLERLVDELIVEIEHPWQRAQADEGVAVERWLEEPLDFGLPATDAGDDLRLHGRPDRIEIHRAGGRVVRVRVLDYKTKRDMRGVAGLLDAEEQLGQTSFQIPVYLLGALARGVPGVDADTAFEGGYLVLLAQGDKDKRKLHPIPAALLDAGRTTPDGTPTLPQRIRDLVAEARAGHFDVDPAPCDQFCPYRAVCRYEPPPLEDEDLPHG